MIRALCRFQVGHHEQSTHEQGTGKSIPDINVVLMWDASISTSLSFPSPSIQYQLQQPGHDPSLKPHFSSPIQFVGFPGIQLPFSGRRGEQTREEKTPQTCRLEKTGSAKVQQIVEVKPWTKKHGCQMKTRYALLIPGSAAVRQPSKR